MRVAFRVDASLRIGSGHVMRCLTLANALRKRGVSCFFICREHEGNLIERIRQEIYEVVVLPRAVQEDTDKDFGQPIPAHSHWLGASWQADMQQTIAAIADDSLDWLIVDHYALDKRWEEKLRSHVKKIMVIDDLADREHDCDLLLDQNLVANLQTRYDEHVPAHCACLLGPEYALLQPEYAELHPRTSPRIGPVQRILVFFGGVDQHNLTGLALAALLRVDRNDIAIDIVISPQSPNAAMIRAQAQQNANFTVVDRLPSLAPLMLKADLAIGAGGATSWERCCLGLPTLVITLAENQRPIAEKLHQRGLVRWLGHYETVTEDSIFHALLVVIEDAGMEDWSRACMELTDGQGVERVASILTLNADTQLKSRLARFDDEDLLFRWANDPMVCQNAFNSEKISIETHKRWFYSRLRDHERCRIYIAETENTLAIGQVRFELSENGWSIDYSLSKAARGYGLGKKILEVALLEFRRIETGVLLFDDVKKDNNRASEVFESFALKRDVRDGRWSIAVCSDSGSWINPWIAKLLLQWMEMGHQCIWSHDAEALPGGDLCFYLSYGKIVGKEVRDKYRNNLVVHESNLPKGKGWSPLTWQILEGKSLIPITLIEADDRVDSGPIYAQVSIEFMGHELVDELRGKQADATVELCRAFVNEYPAIAERSRQQEGGETFYSRRRPVDSRLDTNKPILELFNLLRIVDNKKYPAYFEMHNREYRITIESLKKHE